MTGSGKEEATVALLPVSGSVSLCSWQSQKESAPSQQCGLGKCDDLSENVRVDETLHSQHFCVTFPRA